MSIFEDIFYILQDAVELGLIWSLMSIGIFISFRVLQFADLTAEGTLTLGSAIAISSILVGVPPILATLIALVGGFVAGGITGLLHTKLKIPAILAGIISMIGMYSINLRIMGKSSIYLGDLGTIHSYIKKIFDNTFLKKIFDDPFVSKSITTFIIVALIFLLLYWFFGTEIGMSVRATGMNQKMARAQGINTDLMVILGLALSNGLIAMGGALTAQSAKSANMDIGKGTIVIGLASIIIGEVFFGKRSFKNWLISVILGSIIYQALVGVAIALGLNPNDLKLLQAILIAFILALPIITNKGFFKRKKNEVHHAYNQ